MSFFYIEPINNIKKSYNEFLFDVAAVNHSEYFIRESDCYKFFTIIINKIISNQHCCILDSDFSDFELQIIQFEHNNKACNLESSDLIYADYNQFINKVKLSNSEISIFTSGTTGKPKRIIHTIQTLVRSVKLSTSPNPFIWAFAYNPTHIAGLQVFFQVLFNKNTLVNLFKKNKHIILSSIDDYGITHISATPTFYRLLFPFEKEFTNVQRVTFGGEKSDTVLYDKVKKIFPNARVTNIYASTELGTLLHANGDEFQIPKDLENDVFINNNELFVSAKLLGKSDELVIENGLYRTGDIVEVISINPTKFKFVSRNSDYVNIGGYKVNIQEVESVINSIDGVQLVNVSAKANSILGNVLTAFVMPVSSAKYITEKFIKDVLKSKLQEFKIPRVIKIVEDIEFTRSGKLLKK
jgi:acyl-coenzyme A synthetase/AMP-(fatty) acid ligase